MTQGALYLITGGARSGKSQFAHQLALKMGTKRLFVATAEAYDSEMQARIDAHRRERGAHYQTLEGTRDLAASLLGQSSFDVILIDCLTLWISHLMMDEHSDATIGEMIAGGITQARQQATHTILVSNEVGFGIVPDNALARRFRDLNGKMQQRIGAEADALYLACMGRMLPLHELGIRIEGLK